MAALQHPRAASEVAVLPDDIAATVRDGRLMPHVGLVGCGRWGLNVVRDLRALGCRVSVVARPGGASETRAQQARIEVIVPRVADLPDVDGAIVATINAHHATAVLELLPRGIPIFVEKPLTDDVDAADALAEAGPDLIFVMHKWRYHTGVRELKRIIDERELGPVVGIESNRAGWRTSHPDSDVPWVVMPHDLSIILELLGTLPDPRWAVGVPAGRQTLLLMGVLGTQPWAFLRASGVDAEFNRRIRVICEGGVAELADAWGDTIHIARGERPYDPDVEERRFPVEMPLLRELFVFVEHLRGGPPPKSSAAEGAREVRVIRQLRDLAGVP